MAEGETQELQTTDGQAESGSQGIETTADAPNAGMEQSSEGTETGITDTDSGTPTEETFFDPRDIEGKPELESAYKQMQRAFTKRMQSISSHKEKIEAYDAFQRDPISAIQEIARQQGYNLVRSESGQPQQQGSEENWEPKSWDDVMQKATQSATNAILEKLNPFISEVQGMKKSSIERQLSEIDPTWQQYEDDMKIVLGEHPTLAKDPAKLYRMSVPPEVLESRAMQKALKKYEDKAKASKVSGPSTTTKQPGATLPDKAVSFQEAVEIAKRKLAEDGLHPPGL